MFFLFLISLHVHIKRPYCNCSVVLGDLPRHRAMILFKVISSTTRISGDY